MKHFILVCVAIISLAGSALAQPDTWVQSNGPYGGFVNCLAQHGNEIMAGTQTGIFASTDDGGHWARVFPSLPPQAIVALAIAPDGTILAASNGNGVLVSQDGGISWVEGSGLTDGYPSQVLVSKTGNYFVLASNVYKSTDRGDSWHLSGGTASPITDAFCQDSSGIIYTASVGRSFISTDDGETWAQQLPGLTPPDDYAIQTTAAGTLLAATDSITYRSTDQGRDWIALTNIPKFASVLSVEPGEIFAAGYWNFSSSSDNGDGWTTTSFEADPTSILSVNSSNLLVGALNGVFASNNNGTSWAMQVNGMTNTSIGQVVAKASGDVFAATVEYAAGVFHSSDNGASWVEANIRSGGYAPVHTMALLPSGSVLAGTYGSGLFRTSNNAQSWQQVGLNLPDSNVLGLAATPSGELLAGTLHNGALLSTDSGNDWVGVTQSLPDTSFRNAAADSIGRFLLEAANSDLWYSNNNGATWQRITDPPNAGVYVMAIGLGPNGTIYTAPENGGIRRTADLGSTWESRSNGLPSTAFITSLVFDRDTLYATSDTGIYRSTDEGMNWASLNDGLTFLNVNSIAVGPNGYFFAGTYGDGVYRTGVLRAGVTLPGLTAKPVASVYPDPARSQIHVNLSTEVPGTALFHLYDELGIERRSEHWNDLPAGSNDRSLDVSKLSPGIYSYTITIRGGRISGKLTILK